MTRPAPDAGALSLRHFGPQDFADYLQLVGNAQVMAMITERALPEWEARAEFERLLANNRLHPLLGHFKVQDANGRFLGLGKLALESADSPEAELGYMLLPAFWGQGWGSAIAAALLARARQAPTLRRLTAIIDPANTASRRILIKQGFAHQEYRDFDGLPGEVLARALPG